MDRVQRRNFLIAAGVLLAAPLTAEAQAGKLRRIGYLAFNTAVIGRDLLIAFRQTMRELGWIDRQNIIIETRFADGEVNRLPALVDELLLLKVDVIIRQAARVEQPTKSDFVINTRTAKALGVTIPQPLLLRADDVIE